MKNVLGHRDGHENLEFLGCIVLEPLQSMFALVGPSVKNAVKIGVSVGSVGVVCLFGSVVVLLETRGP